MSFIYGQSKPTAATQTTLFTATTQSVVSSIIVCNQSAVATTFRIAYQPLGAVLATAQYLYYDLPIAGNDTFVATVGITLASTDVISCYATLATVSFNLFGTSA